MCLHLETYSHIRRPTQRLTRNQQSYQAPAQGWYGEVPIFRKNGSSWKDAVKKHKGSKSLNLCRQQGQNCVDLGVKQIGQIDTDKEELDFSLVRRRQHRSQCRELSWRRKAFATIPKTPINYATQWKPQKTSGIRTWQVSDWTKMDSFKNIPSVRLTRHS